MQKDLQDMEESGIIERSSNEWAAPIVLVKKKDGSLHLCVNYRRLNAVSQADAYPMPRIDKFIDLTTLDLTRGYWQVPVDKESQFKTAFTTPFGLFQFRVMPFGLHRAPAMFQRIMDRIVEDVGDFAGAYLHDLVIYSATWPEHLLHLRTVLQKLRVADLTVKSKKCQFGMTVCLLGLCCWQRGNPTGGGEDTGGEIILYS